MAPLLAQKSGVDRAFERLYRHHAADVYRYALAVLHNQADAEDVTRGGTVVRGPDRDAFRRALACLHPQCDHSPRVRR